MSTYEQYRSMLRVSKHALDDALEENADVMERISAEVTRTSAAARDAKERLAQVEGRVTRKVKDADPKATVAVIEAEVRANPDRKQAFRDLQEAQEESERWGHLLDAWKARGRDIKTLADLYGANYYVARSAGSAPRAQDDRRAAIRAASEGRDARAARIAEDSIRDAARRRAPDPEPAPARRRAE